MITSLINESYNSTFSALKYTPENYLEYKPTKSIFDYNTSKNSSLQINSSSKTENLFNTKEDKNTLFKTTTEKANLNVLSGSEKKSTGIDYLQKYMDSLKIPKKQMNLYNIMAIQSYALLENQSIINNGLLLDTYI